jgi:hypothetical protein
MKDRNMAFGIMLGKLTMTGWNRCEYFCGMIMPGRSQQAAGKNGEFLT